MTCGTKESTTDNATREILPSAQRASSQNSTQMMQGREERMKWYRCRKCLKGFWANLVSRMTPVCEKCSNAS